MDNKEKQYKFKGEIVRCTYDTPDFKIYAVDIDKTIYPEIKQNKYKNLFDPKRSFGTLCRHCIMGYSDYRP